jgi:agmatinase
MIKNNFWNCRFMGSKANYDNASVIMVGAPMDFTTSYRPGARFGPQKIRETSYGLEEYSPYLDRDLSDSSFYDAGDLELVFGDVQKSLDIIGDAAAQIYSDDKKPLFLGGEHTISYPVIKQAYMKYKDDLALLHFDAHADLRPDYLGQINSHASVIRRCGELIGWRNIYQFGIRSGPKDEFDWGRTHTNFYPFEIISPITEVLPRIGNRPVYITIDIDVLDPAYACGTGTPEPGGCSPVEFLKALIMLSELNVVGMDVVEVSPIYDSSDRTPILAAKIVREGILAFFNT